MRSPAVVLLLLVSTACPQQRYPERGVELRYACGEGARAAVERRLAEGGFKAHLVEEARGLVVRVPEGTDAIGVKQLIGRAVKFEFCEEAAEVAKGWCELGALDGAQVEREANPDFGCFVSGVDPAVVERLATHERPARVLLQRVGSHRRSFAAQATPCFVPRIDAGHARRDEGLGAAVATLTLYAQDGARLESLTKRLVSRRLLLVLDGEVQAAPVVMQPIPGGKVQVVLLGQALDEVTRLIAALVGPPLPTMELIGERRYGPPGR